MKKFTINDVVNNDFYELPKSLFKNKYFKLSNDSKIAYCLLRDCIKLNVANNWINSKGVMYLIFSNEELIDLLQCNEPTLVRIKSELVQFGLIEEVNQGFKKPRIIYINHIT